jgi:hypothetical protein
MQKKKTLSSLKLLNLLQLFDHHLRIKILPQDDQPSKLNHQILFRTASQKLKFRQRLALEEQV